MDIDKRIVRQALLETLERDLETVKAAQRLTAEGVTHEDARSEGSKDMRATEASYIARGQAQRVEALAEEIARVQAMPIRTFAEDDPVALGALVTVEGPSGVQHLFVAPAGGGARLELPSGALQVVTPPSPIGRALMGARVGDVVEVRRAGTVAELSLEAVR